MNQTSSVRAGGAPLTQGVYKARMIACGLLLFASIAALCIYLWMILPSWVKWCLGGIILVGLIFLTFISIIMDPGPKDQTPTFD